MTNQICCQCFKPLDKNDIVQGPILKRLDFPYVQLDVERLVYCCNGTKSLFCEQATNAEMKAHYQSKWGWDLIGNIKDWEIKPT